MMTLMTRLQFPGRGSLRRGATAIALFAVLLLLVQPVCRASEAVQAAPGKPAVSLSNDSGPAGGRDPDDGPCCSEIKVSAVATSTLADVSKAGLAAEALARIVHTASPKAAPMPLRLAAWSSPPPLPLSYHIRSARIQR